MTTFLSSCSNSTHIKYYKTQISRYLKHLKKLLILWLKKLSLPPTHYRNSWTTIKNKTTNANPKSFPFCIDQISSFVILHWLKPLKTSTYQLFMSLSCTTNIKIMPNRWVSIICVAIHHPLKRHQNTKIATNHDEKF